MADILIVEDQPTLQRALVQTFQAQRYKVRVAGTLEEAYRLLNQLKFDLVLIDRGLPDGDGLELVSYLSGTSFGTRTMVFTARGENSERIEGLIQGADDYVVKPIELGECLLRVRSLLRKEKLPMEFSWQVGDVVVYPEIGVVEKDKRRVFLRPKEMAILKVLWQYKNRVVTRDTLVQKIWPMADETPETSTIDVYLRRIRMAMRDRSLIKTVRGFGYLLKDETVPSRD